MCARWAIQRSRKDDLQTRSILQALRSQAHNHWRVYNRFAKSSPSSPLGIMYIKPPLLPCLGLLPALISFVSVLPPFLSLSPAESTHTESTLASPFESTHAKTPGVGGLAPLLRHLWQTRFRPPLSPALIRFRRSGQASRPPVRTRGKE